MGAETGARSNLGSDVTTSCVVRSFQDWIDHKMKLLKQDKRRRGETIGKLLKVIDDLKESGRLDESKVKDGRSVLSMTLQTRDMTPDERVLRVVDAVELDRGSSER